MEGDKDNRTDSEKYRDLLLENKIVDRSKTLFADKMVERLMYGFIAMLLVSLVTFALHVVLKDPAPKTSQLP